MNAVDDVIFIGGAAGVVAVALAVVLVVITVRAKRPR